MSRDGSRRAASARAVAAHQSDRASLSPVPSRPGTPDRSPPASSGSRTPRIDRDTGKPSPAIIGRPRRAVPVVSEPAQATLLGLPGSRSHCSVNSSAAGRTRPALRSRPTALGRLERPCLASSVPSVVSGCVHRVGRLNFAGDAVGFAAGRLTRCVLGSRCAYRSRSTRALNEPRCQDESRSPRTGQPKRRRGLWPRCG